MDPNGHVTEVPAVALLIEGLEDRVAEVVEIDVMNALGHPLATDVTCRRGGGRQRDVQRTLLSRETHNKWNSSKRTNSRIQEVTFL